MLNSSAYTMKQSFKSNIRMSSLSDMFYGSKQALLNDYLLNQHQGQSNFIDNKPSLKHQSFSIMLHLDWQVNQDCIRFEQIIIRAEIGHFQFKEHTIKCNNSTQLNHNSYQSNHKKKWHLTKQILIQNITKKMLSQQTNIKLTLKLQTTEQPIVMYGYIPIEIIKQMQNNSNLNEKVISIKMVSNKKDPHHLQHPLWHRNQINCKINLIYQQIGNHAILNSYLMQSSSHTNHQKQQGLQRSKDASSKRQKDAPSKRQKDAPSKQQKDAPSKRQKDAPSKQQKDASLQQKKQEASQQKVRRNQEKYLKQHEKSSIQKDSILIAKQSKIESICIAVSSIRLISSQIFQQASHSHTEALIQNKLINESKINKDVDEKINKCEGDNKSNKNDERANKSNESDVDYKIEVMSCNAYNSSTNKQFYKLGSAIKISNITSQGITLNIHEIHTLKQCIGEIHLSMMLLVTNHIHGLFPIINTHTAQCIGTAFIQSCKQIRLTNQSTNQFISHQLTTNQFIHQKDITSNQIQPQQEIEKHLIQIKTASQGQFKMEEDKKYPKIKKQLSSLTISNLHLLNEKHPVNSMTNLSTKICYANNNPHFIIQKAVELPFVLKINHKNIKLNSFIKLCEIIIRNENCEEYILGEDQNKVQCKIYIQW